MLTCMCQYLVRMAMNSPIQRTARYLQLVSEDENKMKLLYSVVATQLMLMCCSKTLCV